MSSAAADSIYRPGAASRRTLQHQSADQSQPVSTQPDSLQSKNPDLAEEIVADQTPPLLREIATKSYTVVRATIPALSGRRLDDAEGSGGGHAAASSAHPATADHSIHEAGPSVAPQDPSASARAPAARSMLEELLGDTFHLLADPAPPAQEQELPAEEASLSRNPGPQAAGGSSPRALAEVTMTRLSSGDVETHPTGDTSSVGCQQRAHAQAGIASGRAQMPGSHMGSYNLQQSLVAPSLQSVLSSSLSMQQPRQYPAKKLTLRERVKLMKGSG